MLPSDSHSPGVSQLLASAALLVGLAFAPPCYAQESGSSAQGRREFETRSEIEAQAKAAEAQHRTGEAWLLRQRLEKGDFQDGDRIVFHLQGNTLLPKDFAGIPDTLTVRAGRRLEFPNLPDLSLDGVLRSELNDKLTEHFARYIREATIRSTPLVRIAILGYVTKPGYMYTLADAPLSDVIMQAGGPAGDANMSGVLIRRGPDVIWDSQDTRAALADGMSLDRLHLRAGDEIFVPQRQNISWLAVFSVATSATALLLALFHRY